MSELISFALALFACGAFALAMDKHHVQVFAGRESGTGPRVAWRAVGWLSMGCAGAVCVHGVGIGAGLVLCCGVFTAAGLVMAWLLPYRAHWMPWVMATALVVGALGVLF